MIYNLGPLAQENMDRLNKENLKRRQKDVIRYIKNVNNPLKHELMKKYRRESQRRRLQNPEYKKI